MELLKLKHILKEKGKTGKELSEAMGVTTNTISNIVSGKTFPSGNLLYEIANYLDVDIKDLFKDTKNKTEKDLLSDIKEKLQLLENKLENQ